MRASGDSIFARVCEAMRSGVAVKDWEEEVADALADRFFTTLPAGAEDITHLFFVLSNGEQC